MSNGAADARNGEFTAVFPRAKDAGDFCDRITGDSGFYAADVKRNRANGRVVTFRCDPMRPDEGSEPGWSVYWTDMCETVGYYGSTFGEPPWGSGKHTATLNGRPCLASM
jgi:hypothetical protein